MGNSNSNNTKANLDNKATQCNPNNSKYDGYDGHYKGCGSKSDLDNHANQLNPNNVRFASQ
jgi:hypothetical protein